MANEVPESVVRELPRPPAPRERPALRAAPGPTPEELHGTIGPAAARMSPPPGSPEARLSDAAGAALMAAAGSSLPGALAFGAADAADAYRNGVSPALALGLMTYGRSAARLADPRRMVRSVARNPNYPAHRLKRRTGYEQGLFGMGVETHGDASFRPSVMFAQGRVEGRLSDLAYMHRDVQVAYPGMENVKVSIIPDAEWKPYLDSMGTRLPAQAYTSNGFTVHGGGGIVVRGMRPGEGLSAYFERADRTLVHEMQHVAQEADGIRAPYAHLTRNDYALDAREVDARNSGFRAMLDTGERGMLLRRATQDTPPELVRLDDKGGDNYGTFRNFLATDEVPATLFGIPVVQDESQYTEKDLAFFRRNPKAAGFYDLGGDDEEPEPLPDGGGGGGPSADLKGGISGAVDKLKKRVGETGEVLDYGIAWMERQAKQTADMGVPALSKIADAAVQPALVGARAAVANATSGGGKYYQPEVRDERYFSEAALRELGESVKGMHGRAAGRADGMDNAAQFNLTQTLGGFTVKDGAVTDKFDINKRYHGVPGWATNTARAVLGAEEDPDKGKVKTRIPLKALRLDAKGGKAEEFMRRNPSLFSHVKSFEKMEAEPYEDVGGYAIGYGAHTDKDGNPVTKDTAAVDEATATAMLARDLLARRDRLAGTLPGWNFMPGAAKQALLDVSMGRDDILSKAGSKGLHADLAAAGEDPDRLLATVKKHYYSYRTSKNPKDQAGLEARRVAGGKLFFGDDFSYDGKVWDARRGFVKKGGR